LDPSSMSGSFITVPVANPPAFWNMTRCSPIDSENLARAFPGRTDGSTTEAPAFALAQAIFAHTDFFIDLHSAGVCYLMPTMAGYYRLDPRSRDAALCFGAPVIWGHDIVGPGRTISSCLDRGIPFLYTEARGAGRIHTDDLAVFRRGMRNLLAHLGILAAAPEPAPAPVRLVGDGNTDYGLQAGVDGFFVPCAALLD